MPVVLSLSLAFNGRFTFPSPPSTSSTLGCELQGFLARQRKIDRARKHCNHSNNHKKEDSCRRVLVSHTVAGC